MKTFTLILFLSFSTYGYSQTSCFEMLQTVKSEDIGTTYYSSGSEAITKVSFHQVTTNDYQTYYFAVVQFTSSYQEYIYQVGSNTKANYSSAYSNSAGKAFYEYIYPYRNVLGCAPD